MNDTQKHAVAILGDALDYWRTTPNITPAHALAVCSPTAPCAAAGVARAALAESLRVGHQDAQALRAAMNTLTDTYTMELPL